MLSCYLVIFVSTMFDFGISAKLENEEVAVQKLVIVTLSLANAVVVWEPLIYL